MKLKPTIVFILAFLISAGALAQPKIEFENSVYDMGTVRREETAGIDIPFTNSGNQPLIITNARGSGTSSIIHPRIPVAPGGTEYIHFKMPTNFLGGTRQSIYITTNSNEGVIELRVKVRVIKMIIRLGELWARC